MQKPDPKALFESLVKKGFVVPLTQEAQKQALGIKMQAPEQSAHAQIAEELIAIQQRNSKGFRIFDLTPIGFPRVDFYPLVKQDQLVELFGPEAASLAAGYYEDQPAGTGDSVLPYWRTLEIPVSGNFLKIEFLPARVNEPFSVYDPRISPAVVDNTKLLDNSDSFQTFSPKHSANKNILIHFQDTKENPILVKHGDSFETEFTSVFVTFKVGIPRFRVVIGSNSKMIQADDRELNTKIAYGPGHGIFNNPSLHAVPFCVTTRDLNAFQNPGGSAPNMIGITSGNTNEADLFTNIPNILNRCYNPGFANNDLQLSQFTTQSKFNADQTSAACAISGGSFVANNFQVNGLAIGWITSFSANALGVAAGTYALSGELCLEIVRYATSGTSVSIIRRITSLNLAVSNLNNVVCCNKNFSEPIRFVLEPRDALRLVLRNPSFGSVGGQTIFLSFSLDGYTWGPCAGNGVVSGFPAAPFSNVFKMTENSYPIDQGYLAQGPTF